jgi:NAD+ synthase (glutamine-hydrolysing)
MALANKFGGLLLTTGNKSEYAVGYATIYGDMCGGYAPLKDLYKTEVFACRGATRRRRAGDPAGGDRRPPSAELRENQPTRIRCRPTTCWTASCTATSTRSSRARRSWRRLDAAVVDRVLRLVRISEWKRHQAAPGPKVSRRAFGRERRYPISNGYKG